MRLTLRTLLAYLDDTLEPLEIKKIGQKVAESDTAQELIARIKQVTRRRRITTPPATGSAAFDPNTVAEYLDNELSAEQVAEVEKLCLESDVHLAEIASCHQILTLVLGEPALVPPTAKERMYALVRGREAIPFRKAQSADAHAASPTSADADADEMFLLGLPFYRRGSWLRWALPLAGVVLLAAVGIAVWQSVGGLHPQQQSAPPTPIAQANPEKKPNNAESDKNSPEKTPAAKQSDKGNQTAPPKKEPEKTQVADNTSSNKNNEIEKPSPDKNPQTPPKKDEEKVAGEKTGKDQPEAKPTASVVERRAKPSTERVEVGKLNFALQDQPRLLVAGRGDKDGWQRVGPGKRIFSSDRLVSLPGYQCDLRLDSGVRLLLWGHVRELTPDDEPTLNYLQESAITLHRSKDVDADLTLSRGRIYVSNHKSSGAARVRLRFEDQVWDMDLLEQGTEVAIDLVKRYGSDIDYMNDAQPHKTLFWLLLNGKANLSAGYQHFPNLGRGREDLVLWNNAEQGGGLEGPAKSGPEFRSAFVKEMRNLSGKRDVAEQVKLALQSLFLRMTVDKDPITVLEEDLQKKGQPMQHALAIYCLGAMDEVDKLIGILGESDARDREAAMFTLRRWLGRDASQGPKLYDPKKQTDILRSRGYTQREAQTVFILLHDLSYEQINNVEFVEWLANDLLNSKTAIADLAHWQLYWLTRSQGLNVTSLDREKFNAADPPKSPSRQAAATAVKKLIDEGKLPPRAVAPTGPKRTGPARKGKAKQ